MIPGAVTPLEEIVGWFAEQDDWSDDRAADELAYAANLRAGYSTQPMFPGAGDVGARIYVISDRRGFVKIGIARDPYSRVRGLSTGNPIPLHVAFYTDAYARGYACAVEAAVHDYLAAVRECGEWFRCCEADAIRAIYLMGGEGAI